MRREAYFIFLVEHILAFLRPGGGVANTALVFFLIYDPLSCLVGTVLCSF